MCQSAGVFHRLTQRFYLRGRFSKQWRPWVHGVHVFTQSVGKMAEKQLKPLGSLFPEGKPESWSSQKMGWQRQRTALMEHSSRRRGTEHCTAGLAQQVGTVFPAQQAGRVNSCPQRGVCFICATNCSNPRSLSDPPTSWWLATLAFCICNIKWLPTHWAQCPTPNVPSF